MNWQKKFIKDFNEVFGEPFLPKNYATARFTEYGTVWIKIGDKDADFNAKGELTGSGHKMGTAIEWKQPEPIEKTVINPSLISSIRKTIFQKYLGGNHG